MKTLEHTTEVRYTAARDVMTGSVQWLWIDHRANNQYVELNEAQEWVDEENRLRLTDSEYFVVKIVVETTVEEIRK